MVTTSVRYRFVGKPPLPFIVVFCLAMANFVAQFAAVEVLSRGLAPSPLAQALETYREWAFPLHFLFLAVLFVIAFVYRRQLVRVDRLALGSHPASAVELVYASTMGSAAVGFVGGIITGAVYSQVSRPIGALVGVLIACAAAFITDRLLVSFPESSLSMTTRKWFAVWSILVSGAVLTLIVSGFV